ncbi:MAG: metallophosphoesterase family protein, partial [bacterium]
MNRRNLIERLSMAGVGLSLSSFITPNDHANDQELKKRLDSFAIDQNRVRFFSPIFKKQFSILMMADTHLFRDDQRGEAFKKYSNRMSKAYNSTKHFQTNAPTNPEACFVNTLNIAADLKTEMVAMIGDMFSFPSEAAVDWIQAEIKKAGLPYVYTAGNHDWHYEGMEDSLSNLRSTWINKRLMPMYQSENPMMGVRELHGIKFITLDNSNYEISPEQLKFFNQHIKTDQPTVLMVHIPLFAPGRSVGFGCGHPQWGAATDNNFELEKRERWPETGHSITTMKFYKQVFSSTN